MSANQKKSKQLVKKVEKAIVQKVKNATPNNNLVKTARNQTQSGFVKGKGDYLGDFLGSAGSKLGNWLSGKAKSFFGMGDYDDSTLHVDDSKIGANSLMAGTSVPAIKNKGQAFIFRHREYVGDVQPSVNFTNTSYIINPANNKTFPWLCNLTAAFEEYQIIGMIAEYKPLVSAVSPNSIGAVVFATEYNVTKPNFSSKIAMENYEYATSCAPHHSMMHAIECQPNETVSPHKNILVGAVPSGQDARLYHWGNLQLATQGQANTTGVIGEFWITYEIACFKPLFAIGQGLDVLTDHYSFLSSTVGNNLFGGQSNATLAASLKPGSLLGTTLTTTPTTTIIFPTNITLGIYQISVLVTPTSNWTASVVCGGPTIVNGSFVQMLNGDNSYAISTAATTGTVESFILIFIVQCNAPGASQCTITMPNLSAACTNGANYDVLITQINGAIVS